MMHQALYRKWRPTTFDDVCGQDHITSVLKYECQSGKFSHAYLFCGSRGTGKTTCAKILAKAVNCEDIQNGNPCGKCPSCLAIDNGSAIDVLEMDAASNNGVDNIRDIRDEVVYTPSMLKYRVYIVDEVHMLSNSAFNALLKTLEEPPAHVIFILATTEMHKLPSTIISRCQLFDFRRISVPVITARLLKIAEADGIEISPDAAALIARIAQGGMRDAVSLLELCSGSRQRIT
ncbi:MAG: DNA polymerase III subunit gamma/tau, partial [Clostridia bacterium]|nr:DNA polymerase III subunit gamma/tau [Clostridia bacterium]